MYNTVVARRMLARHEDAWRADRSPTIGHDRIEERLEGLEGLHPTCDPLSAADVDTRVAEVAAYPAVAVSPHDDTAVVMPAVERALERAGYRPLGDRT